MVVVAMVQILKKWIEFGLALDEDPSSENQRINSFWVFMRGNYCVRFNLQTYDPYAMTVNLRLPKKKIGWARK